ncbi:type IV pilus assembly protein PilM [Protaetiibacter mangrovi]|uniref:Type IV pilus assembly protein PilM n=1 Tax=Protaetiibacter mangrovi TaxID=2970926 RepID=A0ABT1ZD46_9MICO|nr:type IV pilus assembly protein PilM [Protaetiibacter mangrovi]MCS0498629.1 type IV pilus assembly protein PilM [Protaetiibacter mangrovi]TPX02488.1 type IV pilus assembly protein PilM [Schumannella luteola]
MASTIVGLDFGRGVIRAAEVSGAASARPTLVRYHQIAVPTTAVNRGEVTDQETVVGALKQLWAQGGFKTRKVIVGVGNARVLVRELSVPRMPMNRIRETLPFQVQDVLPVPVAEALLDFYPIAEADEDGKPVIQGLLVAAVKESVLGIVEAVEKAKLVPVDVDLIPFALSRSLLTGPMAQGSVALVHIGAETTMVTVAVNGVPHFVRIVQNGSDDINRALVSRLGMDEYQAEQIKRRFGLATQGAGPELRPAFEVIYEATGDLVVSIRNTLSFYLSSRPGSTVERVVLSGGGAELNGFATALADATRLPVRAPAPVDRLAVARSVDTGQMSAGIAGVPVAAGLTLGSKA